jgi:hypothetical protein
LPCLVKLRFVPPPSPFPLPRGERRIEGNARRGDIREKRGRVENRMGPGEGGDKRERGRWNRGNLAMGSPVDNTTALFLSLHPSPSKEGEGMGEGGTREMIE